MHLPACLPAWWTLDKEKRCWPIEEEADGEEEEGEVICGNRASFRLAKHAISRERMDL